MAPFERGPVHAEGDAALPAATQQAAEAAAAAAAVEGDGGTGSPKPPPPSTPEQQAAAAADSVDGRPSSPKPARLSSPGLSSFGSSRSLGSPLPSEPDSEASSGAQSASISPHYDAAKDVVLRLEFLRTAEVKTIIRAVWATVLAGLVVLCVALWAKIDKPDSYYLLDDTVPVINIAFGSVLCAALLACWLIFFYRVYRSNLSHKRWSHRRRRAAVLAGSELTLQLVNLVFFIVPNAYLLSHECSWFHPLILWSGFVRWTIWNTFFLMFWVQAHSANPARSGHWRKYVSREDAAIMDAPLRAHWPKLSLWLLQECILLTLTILVKADPTTFEWDPTLANCRQQPWNCHFKAAPTVLLSLNVACLVAYFCLYTFYISRAFDNLKSLPYNRMRMANLTARLQVRMRSLSIFFFLLCVICFTFVRLNTCSSYIISWLGYLPMQLVMTVTAMANGYMTMPKRPHETGILQVWLQEFAWTEAEVPRKRQERASSLPPESFESFCIDCEPMFCFETSIKMLFWSFLVYDYEEQRESPVSVDTALLLYDLEHFELFWEKSLDTKAVVGWNNDTVVIAFRGTASMANVRADLKAWRTRWPLAIGNPLLCSAPLVHQGFHACYTANNFNERLLARLECILGRCATGRQEAGSEKPITVYVTGHSLGGALATLCAYDIKKRCPCAEYLVHVKCYTFGAPRVGNHAFVREYNAAVPDTWHIINNDDVVTQAGKFWVLYKRTGHRVLLNKLGDLVVRPNYVETAIRGVPGGASIRDHLLTHYQKAVMAVVAAQFGRKSFEHGKDGVMSLTQQKGMQDVLTSAGLSGREIRVLQERGWDAYQRLLRKSKGKGSKGSRGSGRRSSSLLRRVQEEQQPDKEQKEQQQQAQAQEQQLEAVVVQAAVVPPEQQAMPAAGAAADAGAGAAADVGAAGAEADALERGVPRQTSEERDGVLHTAHFRCRMRNNRRCQTICQMMNKRSGGAAAAAAGELAAPELDVPPASPVKREQALLQAIAEEQEQPSGQQRWGAVRRMASLFGLDQPSRTAPLKRTASATSSGSFSAASTPTAADADAAPTTTRGSVRDAPAFPLVVAWGGNRADPAAVLTPEEISARALTDYYAELAAQQKAAAAATPAAGAGSDTAAGAAAAGLAAPGGSGSQAPGTLAAEGDHASAEADAQQQVATAAEAAAAKASSAGVEMGTLAAEGERQLMRGMSAV